MHYAVRREKLFPKKSRIQPEAACGQSKPSVARLHVREKKQATILCRDEDWRFSLSGTLSVRSVVRKSLTIIAGVRSIANQRRRTHFWSFCTERQVQIYIWNFSSSQYNLARQCCRERVHEHGTFLRQKVFGRWIGLMSRSSERLRANQHVDRSFS